jgi:hypothetical protein
MMDSQETKKVYTSKKEVIDRVKEIADKNEIVERSELDLLKNVFYKLLISERDAKQKEYIEAGGDLETYKVEPDPDEETFKTFMSLVKEQRAAHFQQIEEDKQKNLKRKTEIIEKIKEMATSPDEANKTYKDFKALQAEWKEIGAVPPENSTDVWRNYHHIVEQYYDLLKLNFEARDYDFKKNLEMKTALCEAAEKLEKEPDVVSAFHQLQELHNQYREIGPVAKELREEIWARFKAASTVINKAHQQHFETLRAQEEENLQKKTALCEKVEAIAEEPNENSAAWNEHTKQIIDLQTEWKQIGFAPKKMNVKIFERFRAACDKFFTAKSEYYKQQKAKFAENTDKKRAIIEKAKALSDSTEWRSTSDKLIALQKEWKEIGAVPKKIGNQLWEEFRAECDKFFEARNAANAGAHNEEHENLDKKRSIIEQIKALAEETEDKIQESLQALRDEYNKVGHVPFKEKDKIFEEYRTALDAAYGKLRQGNNMRRLGNFKASIAKKGEDAIDSERSRLMRYYDSLRQEIQTYENNLGFLSAASKKGNALVDEINHKIDKLKADLQLTKDKIKAIDKQNKE